MREQPTPHCSKTAVLSVRGLKKGFGGCPVLRDVSFDVCPFEVVALVGEPGAGKSTLIRLLHGSLRADSGQIRRDPSGSVATVFQDLALAGNLDAVANIFIGAEHRGTVLGVSILRQASMRQGARQILRTLGASLAEADLQRPVRELSAGQRQLIALARAVRMSQGTLKPMLLLDEPFAALDLGRRRAAVQWLAQVRLQGVGVLIAVHDPGDACDIADRQLLLENGRIRDWEAQRTGAVARGAETARI